LRDFLESLIAEELEAIIPTEQPVVTASLVSLGKQRIEVIRPEHQTSETTGHQRQRIHHRNHSFLENGRGREYLKYNTFYWKYKWKIAQILG
jgi:hypothetical protein